MHTNVIVFYGSLHWRETEREGGREGGRAVYIEMHEGESSSHVGGVPGMIFFQLSEFRTYMYTYLTIRPRLGLAVHHCGDRRTEVKWLPLHGVHLLKTTVVFREVT